jgi:hypothetical protein
MIRILPRLQPGNGTHPGVLVEHSGSNAGRNAPGLGQALQRGDQLHQPG